MSPPANRLGQETSPYLQQHADNPVHWYPWGDEALALARETGKPILLSIGYSACHWCHVMAHESFEDPATAAVMNRLYVNIKVDREERPDLDKIYQLAHAALTQRNGGWPLTMFLTPEGLIPFFGGTYFPDEARHGLPGFADLLVRVADFYREHPEDIARQSTAMEQFFGSLEAAQDGGAGLPGEQALAQARSELERTFDARHGGFGRAPKFPHPTNLDRALRHWAYAKSTGKEDAGALFIVEHTLEHMALGGVYDQLGGGFYRYSVDEQWMIPHFEKMLYDNGPLLGLYTDAWCATGKGLYRRVAEETAQWVMREMQSPEGGYYSTLDADSEGEEGKFYRWDRDEVRALLDGTEYELVAARFGLESPANFEEHWHLHTHAQMIELAARTGLSEARIGELLEHARAQLLEARSRRIRPDRDEKILTAWNGLMIKAMAAAGRHLARTDCLTSAERALSFVHAMLWRSGRLLATCKGDRAHLNGYLDDYAFLIDALLELLQARWRLQDLVLATRLADALLAHFMDREQGGFYFTADDHERLIHRPRPLADEATPSGNGVAAQALNRLGYLLGEPRYLSAAENAVRAAAAAIGQSAMAHASLLTALQEILRPPTIIVLRGTTPALEEWLALANADYAPDRLAFAIPADAEALPPALADKAPEGAVLAYVCEGSTCGAPISDLEQYRAALAASRAAAG